MKKVILIVGADPYNGNRGVGALFVSSLLMIQEALVASTDQYKIVVVNSSFSKPVDSVNLLGKTISFENTIPVSVFNVKSFIKCIMSPRALKTIAHIYNSDFVLNVGAGDSFADLYGERRFNWLNDINRIARLFRKKITLLPQTIGPFKSARVIKKANQTLKSSALVFARDRQSLKYVQENCQQVRVFEAVDMAFFMPFTRSSFSSLGIHVGINVSGLLWHGGYTRNNQFHLKPDYSKLILDLVERFLSIPHVIVHIVPHVVLMNSDVENDYEIGLELVEKFASERVILAPFFLNPIQAKDYISGLDFFTGARMHACIAAFSSEVPVVPMAYSRKFNGLFVDTLQYEFLADMIHCDAEEILASILTGFENRKALKDLIRERMNTQVKARGELIIQELKRFFEV